MNRANPENFLLGVIEGFYGRTWSPADRLANARFCQTTGFGAYIYAPKADAILRKRWDQPWSTPQYDELLLLAKGIRAAGLQFGIGLSPYGLGGRLDTDNSARLRQKLAAINGLTPDILCILFDDMPGDRENLATEQLEICELITAASSAHRFLVCPTYYSFDPVLERVFGARPKEYWRQLGAGLDRAVDFFWTGDKVCSSTYTAAGLDKITQVLRRPPVLWDNYPVNDSARASRHLFLTPAERPTWLRQQTAGVVANPMNQAWLSRPALAGLAEALNGRFAGVNAAVERCFPPVLAELLRRDQALFATEGLDGIRQDDLSRLLGQYGEVDHPGAREVCDWLLGGYAFDPACLTE